MNWPFSHQVILPDDDRMEAYRSDIVLQGNPDAVYRLRDTQDIQELFKFAFAERIPLTFAGSQTSLTGSSVAESGILFSTEQQQKILELHKEQGSSWVKCEPGKNLFELKQTLKEEGLFYPPDPTSQKDASLGGTIATNATGEDSYFFGSTRLFVRSLELILPNGSILNLERRNKSRLNKNKNLGGYDYLGEELDYFIGSEGTLGFISKITLDLLDQEPEYFSALVFFPKNELLFRCLSALHHSEKLSARCIELIDHYSLKLWTEKKSLFEIPQEACSALYIKIFHEKSREEKIQALFDLLLEVHQGGKNLVDACLFIDDENKKSTLRDLRHLIPATINEKSRRYLSEGGGKLGTDWWVPIEKIADAHKQAVQESEDLGLEFCSFGHIGNGHPHFDYVAKNALEKQKAYEMIERQCVRAVQWGGGVAGEHGIGKVKRQLLKIQYTQDQIQKMLKIKHHYDSHGLFGRGNLFYP